MEYEKLGIQLGRDTMRDLTLIDKLQEYSIKFTIINTDNGVDIIVFNFLEFCKNIRSNMHLRILIWDSNYFYYAKIIKNSKIIRWGNLNEIFYSSRFNLLFDKDFTKIYYSIPNIKTHYVTIENLDKDFIPIIENHHSEFTIKDRDCILDGLHKGLFSENPRFEKFLIEFKFW